MNKTSKERRKQKREEERRMLADFDAAVAAERERGEEDSQKTEGKKSRESFYSSTQPETLHCRRCKTLMEEGVCPVCGYKTYTPMSEEKRKKVKGILTVVCLGVFLVLFLALQLWK